MLRNYLKVAWRNLTKNKVSSFINIGGLAIGMAVAMLIGLWIYDEVSFNRYHDNYDRIGQVMIHNGINDDQGTYDFLPVPVAEEIRTSFPRDVQYVVLSTGRTDHILAAGDKKFSEGGGYMQPQAPDMLTLHMLEGSRSGLSDPHSILLSASLAGRLFGKEDAMNKVVRIDNRTDVKVTGVYQDIPQNSSFGDIGFIAPWDLLVSTDDWVKSDLNNWNDNSFHIYVQLAPNADFQQVSTHIRNLERKHVDQRHIANDPALFVHPMRKWHLYSHFENRVNTPSEALKFVWFYSLIGIFVLSLACINFMNLSTARSEKRAREVGVRKTMGSARLQLVVQFYAESLLTAILAFGASLLLVQLLLPWFGGVSGKALSLPWASPSFWGAGILFILVTGLLAGSYPAVYLSSFRPVKVLKGTFRTGHRSGRPRQVLVVFQFTISIALVIGTLIVYRQIQFAKDRPVGYSRAGLIQIPMTDPDLQGKYDVLTTELRGTGMVASVAESSSRVTGNWSNTGGIEWEGKEPNQESDFAIIRVTPEYGKTVGFQLLDGRDFSRNYATDSSGFVINEAAARYMGLKNPVGKMLQWNNDYEGVHRGFRILAVVKDMVMNSPFEKVKQTIFRLAGPSGWIIIKVDPRVSMSRALPKIAGVFKQIAPSAPFDYTFADEDYASKFAAEERVGTLAAFFAILAIFISCLGLFGLAAYVAEQRTKEIGVRKVLGASVLNIWRMLSLDFVKLTILSCLVAVPLAYFFMQRWLGQYEYRSSISPWLLGTVGAGALGLTLATVSFQAIRAARRKPVKSLRAE